MIACRSEGLSPVSLGSVLRRNRSFARSLEKVRLSSGSAITSRSFASRAPPKLTRKRGDRAEERSRAPHDAATQETHSTHSTAGRRARAPRGIMGHVVHSLLSAYPDIDNM